VATLLEDAGAKNHGCDKGEVYMANAVSASGFGLLDDGEEKLVAKDRVNLGWDCAGMGQQTGELIPFITMQQAMANGLAQAAEVMKDNLGGSAEFILACCA
jgi:hypothetical protein